MGERIHIHTNQFIAKVSSLGRNTRAGYLIVATSGPTIWPSRPTHYGRPNKAKAGLGRAVPWCITHRPVGPEPCAERRCAASMGCRHPARPITVTESLTSNGNAPHNNRSGRVGAASSSEGVPAREQPSGSGAQPPPAAVADDGPAP